MKRLWVLVCFYALSQTELLFKVNETKIMEAPPTSKQSSVKGGIQQGASTRVHNMVVEAGKSGATRLRSAGTVIQSRANMMINKAKEGTIEGAKLADKAITGAKNFDPSRIKVMETTLGNKVIVHDPAENTHTFANKISDIINRNEGVYLGGTKGTGNVRRLDDVPRIKEVEVNFKRNDKHDSEEFARQLKDQEKGMNELTVDEYLKNREKYIEQGRAIEGNAAHQAAREEAYVQKIE